VEGKRIIRFKYPEGVPADLPLARWFSAFCMAVNDLLLVNRWLIDGREEGSEGYENLYLGRLVSAHLHELGVFLYKTDKDHLPEVRDFLANLDPSTREPLAMMKALGRGDASEFSENVKRARERVFHYQRLVVGEGEDYDPIKMALEGLARLEAKKGKALGEIIDAKPPIEGFRAGFADDVAINISFPTDPQSDDEDDAVLGQFLSDLSSHVLCFMPLAKAILQAYVDTRPPGAFWTEDCD
jgi:hypothetical protein